MNNPGDGRWLLIAAAGLGVWAGAAMGQAAAGGPLGLYLRAGTVDTSTAVGGLAGQVGAAGSRHVIQLDGPITPARRARLEGAGIRVGDYLPDHAYVVSLENADARAVEGLEFVRWWSAYESAWKLDPDLGRRAYTIPARAAMAAKGRDALVVAVFAGADVGAVEKAIWAIPGSLIRGVEQVGEHMEIMAEAPLADAGRLALIPGVQFIEPAPEVIERSNQTTRWIVQSNIPGVTPLYANGLHGEGQIVGILDSAVDSNHCSFKDAVNPIGPSHRKIVAYNGSLGAATHGTHVAGIAVGDAGVETADTRGVAYLGRLTWGPIPAFTETAIIAAFNLSHSQGARVHTNSWGDDGTTAYNGLCRGIDSFSYSNEDDLVCFAVTNQSALKNPENAKNLMAVGNTRDTPSQGEICTGGTGPTSDGRRKPEIWAPGCSTLSSASGTTCGTVSLTGTSMASPAIAGTALLVRQYYTSGYYPLGSPSGGSAFVPSGALVKATLLNSAVDMTGVAGYPSNAEGWGRVLADNALYFPGDARKLLVSDVRNNQGLSTGGLTSVPVAVLGSGQRLQVSLVWTEPAAAAGAGNAAVNDLDLEVVSPGGATYLGNVFNTSAGVSVTGGTRDNKNNVEQVILDNPPAGQWTVRVKGANVAQGLQGYAVVVTGDIQGGTPPPLVINLPAPTPALIPPGVPTEIPVQVIPGSQNVVPGSPALQYRFGASGSFLSLPLAALGGNDYMATLPGAQCGLPPQFYFTAAGDLGAAAALPADAPASFFTAQVGTVQETEILSVDMDQVLPPGWSATGLWHLSSVCAPGGTPCAGARWAYYGQDATCNFVTSSPSTTNAGTLTSPPVQLPAAVPGGTVRLSYCSALQTENAASYDIATVLVNGVEVERAAESAAWELREVDLSAYAGQVVTVSFKFDSVDGVNNNYRGWQVDNIRITASAVGCQAACYANCDGSTVAPILNVSDFTCFLNKYAAGDPYANCDHSSTPPILNVNDFVCFQTSYAAGCS